MDSKFQELWKPRTVSTSRLLIVGRCGGFGMRLFTNYSSFMLKQKKIPSVAAKFYQNVEAIGSNIPAKVIDYGVMNFRTIWHYYSHMLDYSWLNNFPHCFKKSRGEEHQLAEDALKGFKAIQNARSQGEAGEPCTPENLLSAGYEPDAHFERETTMFVFHNYA